MTRNWDVEDVRSKTFLLVPGDILGVEIAGTLEDLVVLAPEICVAGIRGMLRTRSAFIPGDM
jgi:hypothetical protein